MDSSIMHQIPYGLYVLTAKLDGKMGGCIINTAAQVTASPNRISVTVNKLNHTCDLIHESGAFNVCILSESAPFSLFKHFGFQSGRDVDKFADFPYAQSKNSLPILREHTCGYISGVVEQEIDLGSHILFIASVFDGEVQSKENPMTYSYYHANVKPKPEELEKVKGGWRCKICGYVYEGDELPADFICPWCKHGAEDFERIDPEEAPKAAAPKAEPKEELEYIGGGKWRCTVCGYVYEGDELPADFVCPVCGVGAELFEKIEEDAPGTEPKEELEYIGGGRWRCTVCGYVYEGDELPADFVCPVCGVGAELFEKIEAAAPKAEPKEELEYIGGGKWRCTICGYIYEGDELPEDFVCPVCGVGAEYFEKID